MPGVGDYVYGLPILDLGTGFRGCDPVKTMGATDVITPLGRFLGDACAQRAYVDNYKSYAAALRYLRIKCESSVPGMPKTNARIERVVQDQLDGGRTLMVAAGFPSCFWTYALPCY